jgi:hypothetical protein
MDFARTATSNPWSTNLARVRWRLACAGENAKVRAASHKLARVSVCWTEVIFTQRLPS